MRACRIPSAMSSIMGSQNSSNKSGIPDKNARNGCKMCVLAVI
jgi:hypothetical protein